MLIAVSPGQPDVVYLATYGVGGYVLWKSQDSGQSWHPVSNDQFTREYIGWLLSIPRQDSDKVYVAGVAGFYETEDGGSSLAFS